MNTKNPPAGLPLILYTFVITSPTGAVIDFGTYYDDACCQDTATDSPCFAPGNTVTLINHDTDGSSDIKEVYTVPGQADGDPTISLSLVKPMLDYLADNKCNDDCITNGPVLCIECQAAKLIGQMEGVNNG